MISIGTPVLRSILRLRTKLAAALVFTLVILQPLRSHAQTIPTIEKSNGHYHLLVDGQPYFVLGAQVHNSSGWPASLEQAWPVLTAMHCNTISVPVYWEAIEPTEGQFDFSTVDQHRSRRTCAQSACVALLVRHMEERRDDLRPRMGQGESDKVSAGSRLLAVSRSKRSAL